ncbi:MAG: class I SAM-dependent methyltransferase [Candidatus Hydrogenedens sp.]|nr:class I SAM-dependent methyltransferase [Candidatus Hydrogenedens sp.]
MNTTPTNRISNEDIESNQWISIHHETEKDYWWFILKRELILHLANKVLPPPGTVLEVGCGGGKLSYELQQSGYQVVSTDFEPSAVKFTKELGILKTFVSHSGEGIPLQDESIDMIIMTDVLEHIYNHQLAIIECKRVLRNKGFLIMTVPAFPCLFSSWDRWNHHFRRYTKKQLKTLAHQAHFHIKKLSFWNIPGIPFAVLRKIIDVFNPLQTYQGFPPVPRMVEVPLKVLVSLENKWIQKCSLPIGLSLVCIFQKQTL